MLTGLLKSPALSTLHKFIVALALPETVPVKAGLARGAFAVKAVVIVAYSFSAAGAAPIMSDIA